MPTADRRIFVRQSLRCFLRQDYPNSELIIVDDGADAVGDLIPDSPRIHYIRLEQTTVLGTKRNLACELGAGDVIAFWDDDDWMAPHRLSLQIGQLLSANADVCGTSDLLHYWPEAGQCWLYNYPAGARPWLAGGTLVFRRTAWDAHPFPSVNLGEDTQFVWQHSPDRLHVIRGPAFYVALIHPRNTSSKYLADPCWQRRPLDEVSRLLAPDREFYASLRQR